MIENGVGVFFLFSLSLVRYREEGGKRFGTGIVRVLEYDAYWMDDDDDDDDDGWGRVGYGTSTRLRGYRAGRGEAG